MSSGQRRFAMRRGPSCIACLLVVLAGCGGSESGTAPDVNVPDPAAPIATLQVIPQNASVDSGAVAYLSVQARSAAGTLLTGRPVSWSSRDPLVATVSNAGIVSGLVVGGTYVVAVAEGVRDSATVSVRRGALSWGTSTPALVSPGPEFVTVTAGNNSSCALDAAGHASCWGTILARVVVPMRVPGDLLFSSIVTGGHTCALDSQGTAYCWGRNDNGQLGVESTVEKSEPTAVVGGFRFKELTRGLWHTCGVTIDDIAYCWGANFGGGLGDGSQTDRHAPVPVVGGLSFVTITAGSYHTCALTAAGEAYCWGGNLSGVLGLEDNFSVPFRLVPTRVVTDLRFSVIRSGPDHVCALTADGVAHCWGSNRWGQLGRSGRVDGPAKVDAEITFADISPGESFTCGLDTAGAAHCWGVNGFGQLGNGLPFDPRSPSPTITDRPTPVVGGHLFQRIGAGHNHACALTIARALYCWGHKENGAVGVP